MATNNTTKTAYTTKTASLKAINADIRKVTADTLKIKNEGEHTDILTLINDKSGINVGYGDELISSTDTDGIGKKGSINFRGSNVMLVENADGSIDLWFGPNNNPAQFNEISDVNGGEKYVYASSDNSYDITGITAGSPYTIVDSTSSTETIKLNNGEEMTVPSTPAELIVTVNKGNGSEIVAKHTMRVDSGTVQITKEDANGITISITDAKVNNSGEDANAGFTPGFIRCKASVSIDNSIICPNSGTYTVTISFAEKTYETSRIFVYAPYTLTAADKPTVEASYNCSNTRNVSGLEYNDGGNVTVTVTDIKNTQKTIATDTNRLTLSENSGIVSAFSPSTITVDNLNLILSSGDETKDNAIYSYTASTSVISPTPAQLSCTVTAKPHGQDGVASTNAAATSNNVTSGDKWIWTGKTADTALVANFYTEDNETYGRKYNTLANITGTAAVAAYDSTKSLATDYATQLLVQGGQLKYPNSDTTRRYSGLTGTRYYVRPINFTGSSGQISTISVDVASGMESAFNNGVVRLYLAKKGVADPMVLNCYSKDVIDYGKPIGNPQKPTSGAWECNINNDVFQLYGNTADTYYLVVEMLSNATIGAITLAKVK